MFRIPHHEFWPGRWYEAPAYVWLGIQAMIRGVGMSGLLKSNYGLDHGGAGFVSKYQLQADIGVHKFPETILLKKELSAEERCTQVKEFATIHQYPIILKPDAGFTGRGVFKVDNDAQVDALVPLITIDYLAQNFIPANVEFGVFYVRYQGVPKIIGMNQKHFPTVTGDGVSTLQKLIAAHPRYNHFWHSYVRYLDLTEVIPAGEERRLSFIGSHTLGCKFTNDTNLLTPELEHAIFTLFEDTLGFNFGRLDVLADSIEAFQAGKIRMIEVNAVNALPTNVFDPDINVWESYRIFFEHMSYLAKIAKEQQQQSMDLLPLKEMIRRGQAVQVDVMRQQDILEKDLSLEAFA